MPDDGKMPLFETEAILHGQVLAQYVAGGGILGQDGLYDLAHSYLLLFKDYLIKQRKLEQVRDALTTAEMTIKELNGHR